jgi:hypothetical protein
MPRPRPALDFLRLWLIVALPYAVLRAAFNIAVLRLVDLRVEFVYEVAFVSLGQAAVLWLITRRRPAAHAAQSRGSRLE